MKMKIKESKLININNKRRQSKKSGSSTHSNKKNVSNSVEEDTLEQQQKKKIKVTDKNGFSIGDTLIAKWMEQAERTCVIIDSKKNSSGEYMYYVHWHELNRRMDEWINEKEIVRHGTEEGRVVSFCISVGHVYLEKEMKELQEKVLKENELDKANSATSSVDGIDEKGIRTRGQKRKTTDDHVFAEPEEHDEHEGMDAASIREHEEVTKVKNVRFVEIGKFRMAAWYFSPFPKEYFPDGSIDCLYFCEFCLTFFKEKIELQHHQTRQACPRHPPGNEIYRHEGLSVFEVDGAVSKPYCQNLCYFAKLFLDHKTLYYDVDPFLFYLVCEVDNRGFHPVGYFSKEKYSEMGYNLACILTFPCHQRKGYGSFIIQFSYELSMKEEKVGSPEKPLSDLGLVSYRSYWSKVLLGILKDYSTDISIMELTKMTSIKSEDIISTLQFLNVIKYVNGQYVFYISPELVEEKLNKVNKKKGRIVDSGKLHWAPLHIDIKRDKWSLKSKLKAINDE